MTEPTTPQPASTTRATAPAGSTSSVPRPGSVRLAAVGITVGLVVLLIVVSIVSDDDPPVGSIVAIALFGAAVVALATIAGRPTALTLARVQPSAPTMELRPESPALASALVNLGAWSAGAVPATFLDLAARDHLSLFEAGPGHTIVYRRPSSEPLRSYEQLFLTPIESTTSPTNGVPLVDYIQRLDFGVADSLEFERAIHSELLAAGLMERAGSFISWERLTPAGRAVAGHWLGLREFLDAGDAFDQLPPAAVTIWDRYLAYAAALGVAFEATAPIIAAFDSRLPTAADIHAARSAGAAYTVTGAAFDPADYGVSTGAPFGSDGTPLLDLRGLLAGWVASTRGVAPPTDWVPRYFARVQRIEASLPENGRDDAHELLAAMTAAVVAGYAGAPLDQVFANLHPEVHRFFADCSARAGVDGTDEIRRWTILRHIALHGS